MCVISEHFEVIENNQVNKTVRISEREHNVFLLETKDVSHLRDSYRHSRTDINTRENRKVFEFLMPN